MAFLSDIYQIFGPKWEIDSVPCQTEWTGREQTVQLLLTLYVVVNTWKVSVFGVCLVRIFPHSDWIRRDTLYFFVFSRNAGKYGPEKLQIRTVFTQCFLFNLKQLLSSFGDKPLITLYCSVARACIFPLRTVTELSIYKISLKEDELSLYNIRKHLSCNLFILLFNLPLWNIHDSGQ